MDVLQKLLVAIVALEHVYILWLEMFMWTSPKGMKTFGTDPEYATKTKALAANQGLYNGFLAAGLFWGLLHPDNDIGRQLQIFFLACILAAALFGGLTAKRSILWMQGLPALAAMAAVLANG